MLSFGDIEAARKRIGDAVYQTPCAYTKTLSDLTGTRLYLKLENLQMSGSFKERGAANKLLSLGDDERARGVIAASAGNHAQGVAYHARRLGVRAVIVMPNATPLVKVSATRGFGAEVVLHGANYDEAYAEARRIEAAESLTFIHPFDDDAVMAGQGTIGLELVEQNPYLDAVVVAVGGGGLAAGVATAIKETNPRIKVYGVEPKGMPSMKLALEAGAPVTVPASKTIADGVAVKTVGARTFAVCQRYLDDVVLVDEEEIAEAILLLLEREKTVAEGAGAAPLAALVHQRLPQLVGKKVAAVVCGGNIDVNVISRIIDRGLVKSGRLMRLRVLIPDLPGALSGLLGVLGVQAANVLQILHERTAARYELGHVGVELTLETRGFEHVAEIERAITESGYQMQSG
jgi:threonine dehydratase